MKSTGKFKKPSELKLSIQGKQQSLKTEKDGEMNVRIVSIIIFL